MSGPVVTVQSSNRARSVPPAVAAESDLICVWSHWDYASQSVVDAGRQGGRAAGPASDPAPGDPGSRRASRGRAQPGSRGEAGARKPGPAAEVPGLRRACAGQDQARLWRSPRRAAHLQSAWLDSADAVGARAREMLLAGRSRTVASCRRRAGSRPYETEACDLEGPGSSARPGRALCQTRGLVPTTQRIIFSLPGLVCVPLPYGRSPRALRHGRPRHSAASDSGG